MAAAKMAGENLKSAQYLKENEDGKSKISAGEKWYNRRGSGINRLGIGNIIGGVKYRRSASSASSKYRAENEEAIYGGVWRRSGYIGIRRKYANMAGGK